MIDSQTADAPLKPSAIEQIKYLYGASMIGDEISLPISYEVAAEIIASGTCLIVREVFDPALLRELYMRTLARFHDVEPAFRTNTWGSEDYWRIDDNPPASNIPKIQSLYFNFLWNESDPEVIRIARALANMRNRIGGLPDNYGFTKGEAWNVFPVIQHYPRGGGNISKHSDPLLPQRCVASLLMEKDFDSGGLFVELGGEEVLVDPHQNPGDIFIFRPNIPHGVAPVDPDEAIDFLAPTGRWRLASILSEAVG